MRNRQRSRWDRPISMTVSTSTERPKIHTDCRPVDMLAWMQIRVSASRVTKQSVVKRRQGLGVGFLARSRHYDCKPSRSGASEACNLSRDPGGALEGRCDLSMAIRGLRLSLKTRSLSPRGT